MKPRDALRIIAPETTKAGFRLESYGGMERPTKSKLLKDRANLRRMVNAVIAEEEGGCDAATIERHNKVGEAVMVLVGDINERLDCLDAGTVGNADGSGAQALKDASGRRIGTLLDAATLRDEQTIAAALGTDSTMLAGDGSSASVPDGALGGLGDFFRGIGGGSTTPAIKASLQEGTDSDGGYAVPNWLMPGIIKALVPKSSMLDAGANLAMLKDSGDSYRIAAVDTIPTPAWRLELAEVTTAGPTFRVVNIVPRDLSMIFLVSRELLADAPNMDDALRTIVSQAFAKEFDRAGLIGTGTAPEITGVLNVPGVQVYDMGTNGAPLTNYAPIVSARRLLADVNAPMPNAVITSTREDEALNLLVDSLGQPLRRPPALQSTQFVTTSQIPITDTHGTATDASSMFVGAWNLATFYLRERPSIMMLRELYAGTGALAFACHARIDLALAYPQAFAVIKGIIPA